MGPWTDYIQLIGNLLATSYEKQSIKGKEERHATESETALQKDANQASKTEKNLSDDSVSAQKGNVKASNTDGNLQFYKNISVSFLHFFINVKSFW